MKSRMGGDQPCAKKDRDVIVQSDEVYKDMKGHMDGSEGRRDEGEEEEPPLHMIKNRSTMPARTSMWANTDAPC